MAKENKEVSCKRLPESYELYINGNISEETLIDFKKDIHDKLDEIEEIISEMSRTIVSLGSGIESIKANLPEFNIHVTTYGGDVYAGLGICDLIKELSRTYKVNMICSGYIMSMGIPIILSGTEVYAYENSTFMIHEITACCWDKFSKIKEDVKEFERLNKILKSIILEKTKITKAEIDDWFIKKMDVFMSAKEALKYGIVTKII